jgi:uncharacterized protein
MLLVLSPAKSLNSERTLPADVSPTLPREQSRAWNLIKQLRQFSAADIAQLMSLSDALATLNVGRYESFQTNADVPSARPALLLFDGDVYDGLNANTLTTAQWHAAQSTVRMLSGLYGVLRPLDLMQAYRLEMGTRLATPSGKNLYEFWGEHITQRLNTDLAEGGHSELLNLASEEYFQSVKRALLSVPVIECAFLDEKNGVYKTISFFAKRARGLMARFVLDAGVQNSRDLAAFQTYGTHGYQFDKSVSTPSRLVFKRSEQAAKALQ